MTNIVTHASLPWFLRYTLPKNDLILVQRFSITQWYSGIGCRQGLRPSEIQRDAPLNAAWCQGCVLNRTGDLRKRWSLCRLRPTDPDSILFQRYPSDHMTY